MNVTQDLSILHLILQASAVVQVVMALLAGVSLMSWYYIFMKLFAVKQARAKTETLRARLLVAAATSTTCTNSAVNDRHHAGSHGAHLRGRLPRIHQAARPEEPRPQGHRRRLPPRHARHLPARDGCPRIAPRLPRLGRLGVARTSACSAPSGASCTPSAACPTSARPPSPRLPRALPKRWSPPPSACSPPFRRCSPTTASRTTSIASPCATRSFMEEFSNIIQRQMR